MKHKSEKLRQRTVFGDCSVVYMSYRPICSINLRFSKTFPGGKTEAITLTETDRRRKKNVDVEQ